jgi:hypothetical protein
MAYPNFKKCLKMAFGSLWVKLVWDVNLIYSIFYARRV